MKRRARAVKARRRQILQAVVALHAECGTTASSYARIAERAGVSIPTVYHHFPTMERLLNGCFALAAESAPRRPAEPFADCADTQERVRALVDLIYREHEYYDRWLCRATGETTVVPELGKALEEMQSDRRRLIREALGPQRSKEQIALAAALLDYPAWRELTHGSGLSRAAARRVAARSLSTMFKGG